MSALRFVSMLALAIWLGGMITIGSVAAPSAFAVLPAQDAATAVGEILRRFHLIGYAAGALLIVSLVIMALIGPRPRFFAARLTIATVMLGATLASGLWVDRRIRTMREEIGVPVASLPVDDARRATFGRLHGLSTTLMLLAAAGGIMLVYWDTREHR
jgi:uncharacterized membrane protein